MKRLLPFVIIIVVLGVAFGAGVYLKRKTIQPTPIAPSTTANDGGPSVPTTTGPVEPGADPPHTLGPPDAPVTVEEFGDFECPPCGMLHPELKTIEREFGSRV